MLPESEKTSRARGRQPASQEGAAAGARPLKPENTPKSPSEPTLPPERSSRPGRYAPGNGNLGPAMMAAISRMEGGAKVRETMVISAWPRAVGEQNAAASEVESVRDGVLYIRTRSSTWSHELNLHKQAILARLNAILGGQIIFDLVFKAKGLSKKRVESKAPQEPVGDELDKVVLDPAEREELRARLEALYFAVADEKVRQKLASRITDEARLRHWRLLHGWLVCMRCGAAHPTRDRLCPICRLTP